MYLCPPGEGPQHSMCLETVHAGSDGVKGCSQGIFAHLVKDHLVKMPWSLQLLWLKRQAICCRSTALLLFSILQLWSDAHRILLMLQLGHTNYNLFILSGGSFIFHCPQVEMPCSKLWLTTWPHPITCAIKGYGHSFRITCQCGQWVCFREQRYTKVMNNNSNNNTP